MQPRDRLFYIITSGQTYPIYGNGTMKNSSQAVVMRILIASYSRAINMTRRETLRHRFYQNSDNPLSHIVVCYLTIADTSAGQWSILTDHKAGIRIFSSICSDI